MPSTPFEAEKFRKAFLILLVVGISLLFLRMIWDFVMSLLLAAILAGLSYPLYVRVTRELRGSRHLAATLLLVLVLVLIVGPLTALLGIVVGQAVEISRAVAPWVQEQLANRSGVQELIEQYPFLERFEPYREDLIAKAGELAGRTANLVADGVAATTTVTVRFFLLLFVMLYAYFFFLIDGRAILAKLLHYLPLPAEDERRMLNLFTSVTRATLKGTLVIGLVQGISGGLGLALVGIPGAVFWGALMTVLSIIPGVGSALVWVPACIYLGLSGRTGAAIILAIYSAAIVGSLDNVLRPRLVGRDTRMPDLLILVSTLGGITLFGAVGIVIGPVVAALFLTVWELYGAAFGDLLPPVALGPDELDRPRTLRAKRPEEVPRDI